MDRPTKPSGRHAVRLRWDEIITRLSFRFNFLAIRHRDRSVVGGLSRLGFAPFSVRLLVHTGFLVARRSDCDVRNVLSRAAPTDPAGSRSHQPDHAPRWCRNPTEIGGGETTAKWGV